jgi:hypothetical protein
MRQALLAIVAGLVLAGGAQCGSAHTARAGFWFHDVSFELSQPQGLKPGGQLREQDIQKIKEVAWDELRRAYAGLRIDFSEDRSAFYRVRVLQYFSDSFAAGRSHVLIGGQGSVSFEAVARHALSHAPPDADRAEMIEGIGRGIGRTAAHEFAHQMLPRVSLHSGTDRSSYEYRSADRAAQYYGPIHWDFAWPLRVERLGQ